MLTFAEKIENFKEENGIFLQEFTLFFREYLDIFAVFNHKKRMEKFIRHLIVNGMRENMKHVKEGVAPVMFKFNINPYFDTKNNLSLAVNYGYFLREIAIWIAIENGIEPNSEEAKKIMNLVLFYYGITKDKRFNLPSALFMKSLFGAAYKVVYYSDYDVSKPYLIPTILLSKDHYYYKQNVFFLKDNVVKSVLDNENDLRRVESFLEKMEFKIVAKDYKKVAQMIKSEAGKVKEIYPDGKLFLDNDYY